MPAGTPSSSERRLRRLRLAFLLPLFSVLSWACFVAVPVTAGTLHLRVSHKAAHTTASDLAEETIPPIALWINGLELPANFVELPLDRLLPTWPDIWHPERFTVLSWRAVTFPFLALPFWCFAGLGWDAMLKRTRLAWPVLLLGSILCLVSIVGATVFTREWNNRYDAPGVDLPIVVATYLWALLLAGFPATWLIHRGRRPPKATANLP